MTDPRALIGPGRLIEPAVVAVHRALRPPEQTYTNTPKES